jgi:large subunit ribosomal protein L41
MDQEIALFGKYQGPRGLTPEHFLRVAREHTYAEANPDAPYKNPEPPSWMSAQRRLGIYGKNNDTGISLSEERPRSGAGRSRRELEVVTSKETTIAPFSKSS